MKGCKYHPRIKTIFQDKKKLQKYFENNSENCPKEGES
jgi:hypothetical protein